MLHVTFLLGSSTISVFHFGITVDAVKDFFKSADWVANAVGILFPLGALALTIWAGLRRWIWRPTIDQVITADQRRKWTSDKVKKVMRIAFVDDQPTDFPTAELKRDGFSIQVFRQVQLADIASLAAFDVVFLDMKGVVKDDPEYGGLKLIADLRHRNPAQKICAVSSKTFDPTATEFFRQADEVKRKPMTAQECRAVIEKFADALFSIERVRDQGDKIIQSLPMQKRYKLVSAMKSALKSVADSQTLSTTLSQIGLTEQQIAPFMTVCRVLHAS